MLIGCCGVLFAVGALQAGMTATTLDSGVYLLSGYANGNILALERSGEVILVDAQSPGRVAAADSALRTLTAGRVRQVIFTHYHEDHVGGMPHWRGTGAVAVAHAAVPAQMAKDTVIADWDGWHRTAAPAAALPDLTFRDSLVLDLAGRPLTIVHLPAAHTDGDAIVWLPWADVLHVGDLVEPGSVPFIDWWAGGSLDGLISAADRILALAGPHTRIVPGHGPVVDRRVVETHRQMLIGARDRIGAFLREGRSADQIVSARPLQEFQDFLGGTRRADIFVRLVAWGLARRSH